MAHIQQRYSNDSSNEDFDYPEPNYPYLYAPRSDAGYTTPAIAQAPLPPPSAAPSHISSAFTASRRVPERAYSDTSRTSGDSYITPSLSASQVGNRHRHAYPRSHASQSRSQAASFVSRDDLRHVPSRPPTGYSPSMSSRAPTIVTSPPRSHAPPRSHTAFAAGSSSGKPIIRRLRSVLKKPRPADNASFTDSSSAPEIISDSPTRMSPPQEPFPMPPVMDVPSDLDNRRSMTSPSVVIQKTRFHGNNSNVSRHLGKPWDARSPPRLDSATRAAPAFDVRGISSIQLIVGGLPWSVHVRAGASRARSRSRSRSKADQITVGDVVDAVYSALNKSLTRTDVRAASNDTKKRIARAAAAAERESQRGEHSARTGKPSAARRIDYLGSRVWFLGLEKNDDFARQEGYGVTEHELKKVWVMRFSSSPSNRSVTL